MPSPCESVPRLSLTAQHIKELRSAAVAAPRTVDNIQIEHHGLTFPPPENCNKHLQERQQNTRVFEGSTRALPEMVDSFQASRMLMAVSHDANGMCPEA